MSEKKRVAVLGAGKMGLGIAQLFATRGHEVKVIYVYDDKTRYDSREVIRGNLEVLADNEVITREQIPEILSHISFVDTIEETADFADIVFEGIIEKLEIKQDYFARMDKIFPVTTVLATNTSAISITEIAEKAEHKERIIGTHYWNPAYLIPLVEVIKTKYVSDETVKITYDLLKEAGKRPVIVKKTYRDSWQTVCSTPCFVKRCLLLNRISQIRQMWMTLSSTDSECVLAFALP